MDWEYFSVEQVSIILSHLSRSLIERCAFQLSNEGRTSVSSIKACTYGENQVECKKHVLDTLHSHGFDHFLSVFSSRPTSGLIQLKIMWPAEKTLVTPHSTHTNFRLGKSS